MRQFRIYKEIHQQQLIIRFPFPPLAKLITLLHEMNGTVPVVTTLIKLTTIF
jgi:hypothetical protein